jgi:hypothetical protein
MSDAHADHDRDLSKPDPRVEGWGGNDDAPELSQEQAAALQEREEPVAAADFGLPLTGDLGRAEVASESVDAPETTEPDTSLGHQGGQRYDDYADGAGGSA